MTDTLTLTEIMREHGTDLGEPWEMEFEWMRQNMSDYVLRLLHLVKRDGITEPVVIDKEDGRVWDGHYTIYVASLLGIRDIPVEYV